MTHPQKHLNEQTIFVWDYKDAPQPYRDLLEAKNEDDKPYDWIVVMPKELADTRQYPFLLDSAYIPFWGYISRFDLDEDTTLFAYTTAHPLDKKTKK